MAAAENVIEADRAFQAINRGYNAVFKPGRPSIGLVVPIETYATRSVPAMTWHIERVQLAESLSFTAVWLRDVSFNVSSFGDAGQVFDPFVYLGALAAQMTSIVLGVASVALNLRFNQADAGETLRKLADNILPDFAI